MELQGGLSNSYHRTSQGKNGQGICSEFQMGLNKKFPENPLQLLLPDRSGNFIRTSNSIKLQRNKFVVLKTILLCSACMNSQNVFLFLNYLFHSTFLLRKISSGFIFMKRELYFVFHGLIINILLENSRNL